MIMWHHYHQYHTCAFYWKTETLFHRFLLELPKIFCDVNYMSYKTIVKVNLYNIYIHIHKLLMIHTDCMKCIIVGP